MPDQSTLALDAFHSRVSASARKELKDALLRTSGSLKRIYDAVDDLPTLAVAMVTVELQGILLAIDAVGRGSAWAMTALKGTAGSPPPAASPAPAPASAAPSLS